MSQKHTEIYQPPSFDGPTNHAQFMSHGEIVTLKKEAYKEGHEQGYTEGKKLGHDTALNEHHGHVTQIIESLHASIDTLQKNNSNYIEQLSEQINYSILLIIKKLLPFYLKKHGRSELIQFVQHTVSSLLDKDGLKISLHPSISDQVKEHMAHKHESINEIKFLEDENLDIYACTMKWKCGGAIYNLSGLHDEIDTSLKSNLDLTLHESEAEDTLLPNLSTENFNTENKDV